MSENVIKEVHLRGQFLVEARPNTVAILVSENDKEVVQVIELDKEEQKAWDRNDPAISGRLIGTYRHVLKIQIENKKAA
jgi:hypothetical protein